MTNHARILQAPDGSELLTLQVFYGVSSPWAYFGMPRVIKLAADAGIPLVLRPIRIIEANGGVPLRTRPQARQDYHAIELARWARRLDMPLNLRPRYYPCRTIEIAAQAIIACQRAGLDAAAFSFAIQRGLWAEEGDIADVATLRQWALASVGEAGAAFVREADEQAPEVVAEWHGNLKEAEDRGIFGTPTYVVANELFWGQDRLDFVAEAIAKAQAQQAKMRSP
jgi:2-hydroxychromene-2-carboxylate isomerase